MSAAINRASVVYIAIFAVFAIGFWMILQIGSTFLTAPKDVSGQWKLLVGKPPGPSTPQPAFSIEQSGKYLQVKFDSGPPLSLVLTGQQSGLRGQKLQWRGGGWQMSAEPAGGVAMSFAFQKQGANAWSAVYAPARLVDAMPSGATTLPSIHGR